MTTEMRVTAMSESARDAAAGASDGVLLRKAGSRPAVTQGPPAPVGLRIGTVERDLAAAALAEHFSAGRLDSIEFDERTRAVYAARVFADLDPLFCDLPAPHPPRPQVADPLAAAWADGRAARDRHTGRAFGRGLAAGAPRDPVRLVLVLLFVLACLLWVGLTRIPPFFAFPLFWLVIMRRPWARRHRLR